MERRKDAKGRVLQKGESQRKDGRYVYQYKDFSGKRRSVYATNLSELRKKEKLINKDLEDNINTDGAKITLNQQFDKYISLKKKLSNSTRQNYIGLWDGNLRDNVLGKKEICEIRKTDILIFYNSLLARGLKYSTVKTFHGMISSCLELAVDDDIIRKNPCKGCLDEFDNDTRARESLTVSQQESLLSFVRQSNVYAAYYPMLVFMIGTAVRCGEAIGLTWDDVNFKTKEISINHQLIYKKSGESYKFYADTPKTNAGIRVIPMTTEVYKALLEQRQNQLPKIQKTDVEIDGYKDFVFSTKSRRPIMPSALNNVLVNIINGYNRQKDMGIEIPHISAHILRHTGCTRMAEAGMDPKVLQYIMGHSKISVTMEVYNHISSERNRKEMGKLEKLRLIG